MKAFSRLTQEVDGVPIFGTLLAMWFMRDYDLDDSVEAGSVLQGSEVKSLREAYDNDEHPESLPIAVIFDVTGSMGNLPKIMFWDKWPGIVGQIVARNAISAGAAQTR